MPAQPAKDFRIRHLREKLGGLYEFKALLGIGAFATVYLVRNLRLDRLEALKVLSETHDSEEASRFTHEAKLVASLDHPNIAKVYDYGEIDGIIWFSMQHIDGPILRAELKARGRFDPIAVVRVAIPLLEALGYSHQMGTVHRDIKPSNILLDQQGRPYLMDFGIAKSNTNVSKTATGNVLGTPAYVSPEQIQGQVVDGRSDLYSLSVAMYEMLAGRTPFKADTVLQTIMMRLQEEPDPLSTHCSWIPQTIETVVMHGLARQPEDRYPDAEAMRDALVEIVNEHNDQHEMILMTSAPTPVAIEHLLPSVSTPVDPEEARTFKMRRADSESDVPATEVLNTKRSRRLVWMAGLATVLALASAMMISRSRAPQTVPAASPAGAASSATEATGSEGLASESPPSEPDQQELLTTAAAPSPPVEPEKSTPVTTAISLPEPRQTEAPGRAAEVEALPAKARPTPAILPPPALVRRPVTAPRIVSAAEPAQAAECIGQSVILSLQVGEDGKVLRSRTLKKGSEACTSAARLAAEAYVFEPARDSRGEPLTASTTINIRFHEVTE